MAKKLNKKAQTPPVQAKNKTRAAPAKKNIPANWLLIIILIAVAVAGFIAFYPCLHNGLTTWDDEGYITNNFDIRDWSSHGLKHLFSSYSMGNYHPITMFSYAIEYHFDAINPYIFHRDSVLLHILTSITVTIFTWLLTRNLNVTAFCGILFVIHPMHVESVAWASGRKDVLFGLFYFLALIAWYYYCSAKKNKGVYYSLCVLFFLMSLLSKGVAVTLPVSCLLIDYYLKRPLKLKLLLEKIPLFLLSFVFGIISIKAQESAGAIQKTPYSVLDRLLYASHNFLEYIWKSILPVDLSNFYIYPAKTDGSFPIDWYIAPIILIALLYLVYWFARNNRAIVFGFLFFASSIFLVLQLLPVGDAIIAERYSYLSYFGLFFIGGSVYANAMKGIPSWVKPFKAILPFILIAYGIYLTVLSRERCLAWKNTLTLWMDEMEKQPLDPQSYNNVASEYKSQGKYDEALPLLNRSIVLNPNFANPYSSRGEIYSKQGKYSLALADLNKSIELNPSRGRSYLSRAILYGMTGKVDSAGADFKKAIQLEPYLPELYFNLGIYEELVSNYDSAVASYSKAILLQPTMVDAYFNRGLAHLKHNNTDAGIKDFDAVLQMNPQSAPAYLDRSAAWNSKKEYKKALDDALMAQQLGYNVDTNYIKGLQQLVWQ